MGPFPVPCREFTGLRECVKFSITFGTFNAVVSNLQFWLSLLSLVMWSLEINQRCCAKLAFAGSIHLPGTLLRTCKPPVTCRCFFKAMDE